MSSASTLTKLPIYRWAQIMGIHPLHFCGVYVNAPTVCSQPWMKYAHQANDRVGREDIAMAIAEAEANLERYLGYRVLPSWEVDEWQPSERPWRPELFNLSVTDLRGFQQVTQADWGYIVAGGVRLKTLIDDAVAIVYTDNDGDGYAETATITTAVTFTAADELAIYFPVAGPVLSAGADEWRVRPIRASISGGVATIALRREQLVAPAQQETIVPDAGDSHMRGVDGLVNGNFVTTVDVYRVRNDPQQQAYFLWEPRGCEACNGTGCTICSFATQTGCLLPRDKPRQSIVAYRPATWNATTLVFDTAAWAVGRQPDLIRLWYYAGWQARDRAFPLRDMDTMFEHMIAYYAAGLLERPICECNNVRAFVEKWQADMAVEPEGVQYKIREKELENPFGTTRGALYAWRRVKDLARGRAAVA